MLTDIQTKGFHLWKASDFKTEAFLIN
jgi:hypothetical protein